LPRSVLRSIKGSRFALAINLLTSSLSGPALSQPEQIFSWEIRSAQAAPSQTGPLSNPAKQLGLENQSTVQLRQANLYLQQGKFAEAEALYMQLLQQDRQDSNLHYKLGQSRFGQKKYQLAIYAYQDAIRLKPNYALAYNSLGLAYASQGRLDEAIAAFRQAIAINANYADALSNLGRGLWQQGNINEAIATLEKARALFEQQQRPAEARQVEQLLIEIQSQPPEPI